MRKLITYIFLYFTLSVFSQNCDAYKWEGNLLKYKACVKAKETKGYYQFDRRYQEVLDAAIKIDSTYDNAYWAKSISYLKSGDFLSWKPLIDKAVELDPIAHLGYRGWCRYQFFRDYKGAIADIEEFEKITNNEVGYCQNGDYHLLIAKAICYKALGEKERAIKIIENYLKENDNESDLFNFYHLGVLYFEKGDNEKALECLKEQEKNNPTAENQYYISLCYKEIKEFNKYKNNIAKAIEMHKDGYFMSDSYTHHYDKVYLSQIEVEYNKSK
jgi:tetratricopeptide (TPR) repeat protein